MIAISQKDRKHKGSTGFKGSFVIFPWTLFPWHPFVIHTHFPFDLPHLRLDVSIVVVLEQQSGRFCVVFASGYVQSREANLAFSVMLQQQGHHRVVALLKSDGQRGKTVLMDQSGKVISVCSWGIYVYTSLPQLQCFGSRHFPAGIAPPPSDSPEQPCRGEWSHSAATGSTSWFHIGLVTQKEVCFSFTKNVPPTWDCELMFAPLFTSSLTTSFWPAKEAMWRAEFPFCGENQHKLTTIYEHVPKNMRRDAAMRRKTTWMSFFVVIILHKTW